MIKLFLIAIVVASIILFFRGKRENLTYLKQYENQDDWRNSTRNIGATPLNAPVWPVTQNPAMANYQIRRESGLASSY